jgi:hypothetical protein
MDLNDVCRIFYPTTAQCTFFSASHGTFPQIYYILGHKVNLSKCKNKEITPCILSDHNSIKLELNNQKQTGEYTAWTSINSKWVKNLNISPETLQLVQERAVNTLKAIGICNDFLSRTSADHHQEKGLTNVTT